MSVQSLNGDSYQGAQVGANVQSQVGTQPMCRQVNALESKSRQSDRHFLLLSRQKETERDVETKPYRQPNQNKDNHCRGESCPHFVNAFGSGLSVIRGRQERSKEVTKASGPRVFFALRREREEFRLSACFPGFFLVCWFFYTQHLPSMEVIND